MSLGRRFVSTGASDAVCLTESVQVFGADTTYSSNKLLYQFENNVTNDVGSPSATNSGATFSSTAKFGSHSADFAGTTEHIDTEYNTDDTALTHSFWMYQHSITGSYNGILGTYWDGGSGVYGYYLWSSNGTTINWRVHTSNAAYVQVSGTVSLNAWHHVVLTWSDSVGAGIYIDGVLAQFTASSSARQKNDETITLGNIDTRGTSTIGYDGLLDQYRYYNKSITAEDVATLYAETDSTTSNTNLFNEGAGLALLSLDTDASDASGYFDGVPTDVTFGVGGKTLNAGRFNGSSSIIRFADNSFKNTTFSVSMWVKSSDWTQSYVTLFNAYDNDGTNGGASFGVDNNKAWIYAAGGAGSPSHYVSTGTSLTDGAWQHLVYRVSGTSLKAYLNNSEVLDVTIGSNLAYRTNHNFSIGAREITGTSSTNIYGYVNADIDQFRYFTSALTTDQISDLYNSGNGETACVHTATANTADFPSTATAIGHYPLDNNSYDNKGTNDGTDTGIEYRFGKYGQAALFDGTQSNEIDLGYNTNYNNFSISAWINPSATTTQHPIVGKWWDGSNRSFQFWHTSSGVGVDIAYTDANTDHIFYNTNVGALSLNRWYFVCVTWENGVGLTITVDGNTQTHSISKDIRTNTSNWFIGQQDYRGIRAFTGLIDQVRIFSSVLSASQITELFNEKPEIDTSNFRAILYKGTSSKQYISNVGFNLDVNNGGDGGYVWIKQRTSPTRHPRNYDTVRGVYPLYSSLDNLEGTSNPIDYDANGFFFAGGESGVNENAEDYVGWVWRAGGEAVNIGVNSITGSTPSIASDVSANTAAGFSIVKATFNTSSPQTVAHGLSSAPEVIFSKRVSGSSVSSGDWNLYHKFIDSSYPENYFIKLNSRDDRADNAIYWNDTAPTSSVFTTGSIYDQNETVIFYCWHSVSGYSKIGSYQGNSTTDNKIYTTDDGTSTGSNGFKPSFVMLKNIQRDNNTGWLIHDTARDPVNTSYRTLYAQSDVTEYTSTSYWLMDFESDGFRLKYGADNEFNRSGDTYIYMAFK